jgi:hypothetical protein
MVISKVIFASKRYQKPLYLSDETGNVHVLDEKYQMNSFIAHSGVIYKIESSNRHDILVTIGTNENNQTVLKIWSISPNFLLDSTLTPRCLHQHKFDENGVVSALALHANLSHVVIGFINGKVLVLKGDITKAKYSKVNQIHSSDYPVTCLNWFNDYIYISTTKDVQYYNMAERNPGRRHIDEKGCAPGCSAVTDNGELVIATGESLKYYNVVEKYQVNYPVPGEKFQIIAHGKYICVMLKDHNLNSENVYKISVFNPKEKLNIFTAQYDHVKSIALQWNSICVLSGKEEISLCRLIENDIDEKLESLFQRNLFDVAVSICQHHGLGQNGLSDVYKRWADFLYAKGEHMEAAQKYIQTIGYLEPSYVIHKLLDAQRINSLTVYLEEIEARNKSRSEHRNLLISCYAKNKNEAKLKKLLETCDSKSDSNFENIESAIGSLTRAEYIDLAFAFAEKFHHHELAVKILTSHTKQPSRALKYLTKERFIGNLVDFRTIDVFS